MTTPKQITYQQFLLGFMEDMSVPEMIDYLRKLEYDFIDKGADPRKLKLTVEKHSAAYFNVTRMETQGEASQREIQESLEEFKRKFPDSKFPTSF